MNYSQRIEAILARYAQAAYNMTMLEGGPDDIVKSSVTGRATNDLTELLEEAVRAAKVEEAEDILSLMDGLRGDDGIGAIDRIEARLAELKPQGEKA